MLQGVDIAVVFSAALHERRSGDWSAAGVRHELGIPKATLSKSFERLRHSRLVREGYINRASLAALLPVLPVLVPARPAGDKQVRGIATGHSAPAFGSLFRGGAGFVWATGDGPDLGLPISPLHPRIPATVLERGETAQYAVLAMLDAVRGGRARELAHGVQGLRKLCGLPPVPGVRAGEAIQDAMGQLVEQADPTLAMAG